MRRALTARPGPQPANRIAPTADEQLARAGRPRRTSDETPVLWGDLRRAVRHVRRRPGCACRCHGQGV